MFRISSIVLTVTIVFFTHPAPGCAAMNALSNNSLRELRIDDTKHSSSPSRRSDVPAAAPSAAAPVKLQLNQFRNSSEYKDFLSFIQRLERISRQKTCREIIGSERFLLFCSKFAAISDRCKQMLFSLNVPSGDGKQKTILDIHREMFRQAAHFHQRVYRYQKQAANIPDLNQFLTRINIGLTTIDAEYAEL